MKMCTVRRFPAAVRPPGEYMGPAAILERGLRGQGRLEPPEAAPADVQHGLVLPGLAGQLLGLPRLRQRLEGHDGGGMRALLR